MVGTKVNKNFGYLRDFRFYELIKTSTGLFNFKLCKYDNYLKYKYK